MNDRIVSVSDCLARIKVILSQTYDFSTVWIQGEVSNLTKHRSGHYYFSIKDKNGELHCVMFSSFVSKLDFELKEGMQVQAKGSINVYETRGSLQLYVQKLRLDGIGALYQELKIRHERLLKEGYFDASHKKNKPKQITKIAIITAKEGAALQDALKTIHKRWPMLDVVLYPSYVQGNLAPSSLIRQIQNADSKNYDALLIIRGGGSFEDLFCFNDEQLVKCLYGCKTYTVSGIGHEVDTTLCDLVCDHRALTPTAAAQWITPDQYEMQQKIKNFEIQMTAYISHRISSMRNKYKAYANHPYLKDPHIWIYEKQMRLDQLSMNLEHTCKNIVLKQDKIQDHVSNMRHALFNLIKIKEKDLFYNITNQKQLIYRNLDNNKRLFSQACLLLDAYGPLKVLGRGYSISKKEDHIVSSINQVEINDKLSIQVHDGLINAIVCDKEDLEWKKNN